MCNIGAFVHFTGFRSDTIVIIASLLHVSVKMAFNIVVGKYLVTNEELGNGSYGKVYLGNENESKQSVAAKKIKLKRVELQTVKKEVKAIRTVQGHPHILQLLDENHENDELYCS